MILQKDEYRIQYDGIWISKAALEECKKHYHKVADKFKPKPKKQELDFRYPFYLGKADICVDLLKHFEPLEPSLTFIRLMFANNIWNISDNLVSLQHESNQTNITL